MSNLNKQLDQLSGHLALIAIPIPNLGYLEGNLIYCNDLDANFHLDCSKESISYSTPTNYSRPGASISHKISGFIRGRSDENDLMLQSMLRYRYVVVMQMQDGSYTRIGDYAKGLMFSFSHTSDPNLNGSLGYSISFDGETLSVQKPVHYPFNVKP